MLKNIMSKQVKIAQNKFESVVFMEDDQFW